MGLHMRIMLSVVFLCQVMSRELRIHLPEWCKKQKDRHEHQNSQETHSRG
jgi:hypothetical protein